MVTYCKDCTTVWGLLIRTAQNPGLMKVMGFALQTVQFGPPAWDKEAGNAKYGPVAQKPPRSNCDYDCTPASSAELDQKTKQSINLQATEKRWHWVVKSKEVRIHMQQNPLKPFVFVLGKKIRCANQALFKAFYKHEHSQHPHNIGHHEYLCCNQIDSCPTEWISVTLLCSGRSLGQSLFQMP